MTDKPQITQLVDRLFRQESGKLVSVLTHIFGTHNLELAEDVVQDSLMEAIDGWSKKDIPQNPTGWLYTVAKNKAFNIVNREKYKRDYASEAAQLLRSDWTAQPALDHFFSEEEIKDDQLRMMFTCCHESISADSQVAMTLKTLCGFSIPEIARAFLTTDDTINKRLVRARKTIRESEIPFNIPEEKELENRLNTVLEGIYLLFNEGYSTSVGEDLIRYELCTEAIRLAELMIEHKRFRKLSIINALLALMYLNASRFPARQDIEGKIVLMKEQDRSLWNKQLMDKGFYYLEHSTTDGKLSKYHILAAISANHCSAVDYEATNWENILGLYDHLLAFNDSPLVVLNRAIALSRVKGIKSAIAAIEPLRDEPAFKFYPLFYSTLAEFYIEQQSLDKAIPNLNKAIELSSVKPEKDLLKQRLKWCENQLS